MKEQLVRIRERASRDGKRFVYLLDYVDHGKRRRISLGHSDRRKAEKQRADKERQLRMGIPQSMRMNEFLEDSLNRTGNQIRMSTQEERRFACKDFISIVGDVDYRSVTLRHAELYRQTCLDRGNSPATVSKKLRQLKRLFQLAVNRKQLDENPFRFIDLPKTPKRKVRVYTIDECERILRESHKCQSRVRWDLLILAALTTGMRRGEILNSVWGDIDFDKQTIDVSPKENTPETWQWYIKDTERRTLPLMEKVVVLLAEHQSRQPERYPYVFVPVDRYDKIQVLRGQGKWTFIDARLNMIGGFDGMFKRILRRAGIKNGRFHDLRNTALTNWLATGLTEYDVMQLAGHSSFQTTHQFYLAVGHDLIDRARAATSKSIGENLARTWRAPHSPVRCV